MILNIIIFVLVFSFLTVPQIFKEEKLLTAVAPANTSSTTNQTVSSVNSTLNSVNSTGNSSSVATLTATATCTVPVYNSSQKTTQDHVVDFITGQVGHMA